MKKFRLFWPFLTILEPTQIQATYRSGPFYINTRYEGMGFNSPTVEHLATLLEVLTGPVLGILDTNLFDPGSHFCEENFSKNGRKMPSQKHLNPCRIRMGKLLEMRFWGFISSTIKLLLALKNFNLALFTLKKKYFEYRSPISQKMLF